MGKWKIEEECALIPCSTALYLTASERLPASGSFIDMADFEHGCFLVALQTFTTNTTLAVYQDTSATETSSIKTISGASQAVVASTNNYDVISIEFDASDLDLANDFRYVTLVPSAGTGSDDYAFVLFIGTGMRGPYTKNSNWAKHVSV